MKRTLSSKPTLRLTLVCAVLSTSLLLPAPSRGQGAGGGPGSEPAAFSVIELPFSAPSASRPAALSDPDTDGIVTVAWSVGQSAVYARVDTATRAVLSSGLLPEPTALVRGSFAWDVGTDGVIVGHALVDDGAAPVRWIPGEVGFELDVLPLMDPDADTVGVVAGINDAGEMVGYGYGGGPVFENLRAAYWSADGEGVIDLNALLPEGSGWTLHVATDLNTSGEVVGLGSLNGVMRAFLLDLNTLEIAAVPLVAGATEAYFPLPNSPGINELGHVVGQGLTPESAILSYFWAGPGTESQLLPSFTDRPASVFGINNLDELTGGCIEPPGRRQVSNLSMGLWEPDGAGGFVVIDLNTQIAQIGNKPPTWHLVRGWDINDEAWIAGEALTFEKGQYVPRAVIVVPNP